MKTGRRERKKQGLRSYRVQDARDSWFTLKMYQWSKSSKQETAWNQDSPIPNTRFCYFSLGSFSTNQGLELSLAFRCLIVDLQSTTPMKTGRTEQDMQGLRSYKVQGRGSYLLIHSRFISWVCATLCILYCDLQCGWYKFHYQVILRDTFWLIVR